VGAAAAGEKKTKGNIKIQSINKTQLRKDLFR
jgi:hypothetical protein